jgi:hypothetical protein
MPADMIGAHAMERVLWLRIRMTKKCVNQIRKMR